MRGEVRKPTAKVDGEIIDRATIQSRIGTFQQISYTAHVGKDRGPARPINAAEFITELGFDQLFAFSGNPEAVNLVMLDAKFSGTSNRSLITSPSYSTGIGFTGRKRNGVHEASILIGLRTDIYTGTRDSWRADNNPGSASVATRLKELTELIIKDWQDEAGGDPSELSADVKKTIHEQNGPRLKLWYRLLDDSVSTTEIEPLGKLKAGNEAVNAGVNGWMVALLRSSKQNFMSVIQAFASAFHLIYQPPSSDFPVGRLIKLTDLLLSAPKAISVMVVSEDLTAGPVRTLPLRKVIITGVATTDYRETGDMKDGAVTSGSSNVVEFPKGPFLGGSIQSFGMPPYLPSPIRTSPAGLNPNAGLTGDNYDSNLNALVGGANLFITEHVVAMCEYHARGLFANLTLSNSQATLRCELDLRFEAGKYYKVAATRESGEDVIFTGIVIGVTHSLVSQQDSPSATSEINFAYVQAEGFKASMLL